MKTLFQAMTEGADEGKPLPPLFPVMEQAAIRPRRGELTLLAGRPGQGKSLMALTMAVRLGLPTLYFSADSSAATVVARAAAMCLNKTTDEIENMVTTEPQPVADVLAGLDNVHWVFSPSPTLTDIDLELAAFIELWGEPPALICVDNLVNCVAEVEGEFYGLKDLMATFHALARDTDACVLVLHHTTESKDEGPTGRPQGSRAVMGKINQLPALILTVALDGSEYRVAAVKNRTGRAVADGSEYVTLYVDLPRMRLYGDRQDYAAGTGRASWT